MSTSSFNYSFEILKQFLVYKIFKAIYLIDRHFKKKIVYNLTSFPEKLPIKKSIQPSFGQIWSSPLKKFFLKSEITYRFTDGKCKQIEGIIMMI